MGLFNIIRALLVFGWAFPFVLSLLSYTGHFTLNIDHSLVKLLFGISCVASLVLFIEWLLALRVIWMLNKAFFYLRESNLVKLDAVLDKIPLHKCFEGHKSLLQYAVDRQMPADIITFLLYKGALITYRADREYNISYTLFYLASYYDYINERLVSFLLSKGAYVNFVDNSRGFQSLSLLQVLLLRSHIGIVELLLSRGADVNYVVEDLELNALMLTAKYVNNHTAPTLIRLLVPYTTGGINKANKYGYTAILFAAENNHNANVITTLVDMGATLEPTYVRSPALMSVVNNVTPLRLAVVYNNYDVISTLLDLGCDPNFVDSFGFKILFLAAAHNTDVRVSELLLKAGADLNNAYDSDNNTPLMSAAYLNPNPDVIRFYADLSNDIRTCNNEGLNFFDYLKENTSLDEHAKQILWQEYSGTAVRGGYTTKNLFD